MGAKTYPLSDVERELGQELPTGPRPAWSCEKLG